ncbi:UDPglucose 6-dehydrogenase/UDP-N-acetyl-D-mannosaminuronic acid dehydrogenase [Bradyrhizobium sp. Rc3b]|uniref:nucleotide sugar dehydrogenase n=2 Tax=Bradyrhizobium TaxID=374 RepID=UPI0008E43411|nr:MULTISPECIES: nucleotide sugar dehydrogenase [unclassified Bradyrhizobium]MBB4376183.1 nucleotide sugar dehydrogenase [Bradyrhizobium sp. SBR1B]SFN44811.1 UDPglucose 6-dehydrogenase/UDP-N-acetyl-D-mannosaminuronic acid dehydrogenase [Bradyrhizobium sp. Rc3b]
MLVPRSFADRSVCILGLGYVGLTLASTMAAVGFRVWGVEVREDVVEGLRQGQPHFHEPGLADQLSRVLVSGALSVHSSVPQDCDATAFIITVGTPLGPDKRVRTDMIEHVAGEVAAAMPAGALVIMRSTVRLGTTRSIVAPILDAAGKSYDLAFCPERTLEGVAIQELRILPQIIGGGSEDATVRAGQLFQFVTPTTVRVRDLETAEMIKLVDNSQRDVHFAFSNEVASMCDAIGVSAADVISAGKLGYPRTNLAMPGPVGGPCLEKDSYILAEGLEHRGMSPAIVLTARKLNEAQPEQAIAALQQVTGRISGFPDAPVVTVLGLAFKGAPETDDLRGTMARPILAALQRHFPKARFRAFDPVVSLQAIRDFGLDPVSSLEEALDGANVAVITNNHSGFRSMAIETLSHRMAAPAIFYDFWNNFNADYLLLAPHVGYMAIGSHGRAKLPKVEGL